MINLIEQNLKEKLASVFLGSRVQLRFLKYSTPLSGTGAGNKVLFFIFKDDDIFPLWIAKTVRNYSDADVIRKGFERHQKLNSAAAGSEFSDMFPQALFVHDTGEEIWYIETASNGRKARKDIDFKKILSAYTNFSQHLACDLHEVLKIDVDYGTRIIEQLEGSAEIHKGLEKHLVGLWGRAVVSLPKVPQHGDLTVDNVIIDDRSVRIVDCDTYGAIQIAGFDIFHLTSRSAPEKRERAIVAYFASLGITAPVDKKLLFIYFLHELLIKKDYILKGKTAASVISSFEKMIVS